MIRVKKHKKPVPLPLGVMADANIELIKIVNSGARLQDFRYQTRQLCCGQVNEMAHVSIKKRARYAVKHCFRCRIPVMMEKTGGTPRKYTRFTVTPWSEENDNYLREKYLAGTSVRQIVAVLHRSPRKVAERIDELGLCKETHERNRKEAQRELRSRKARGEISRPAWEAGRKKLRNRTPRPSVLWLRAMLQVMQ